MTWLIPITLTALLWLWLRWRRDPRLDFDDIYDVEIVLWGTLIVWFAFGIYYVLAVPA